MRNRPKPGGSILRSLRLAGAAVLALLAILLMPASADFENGIPRCYDKTAPADPQCSDYDNWPGVQDHLLAPGTNVSTICFILPNPTLVGTTDFWLRPFPDRLENNVTELSITKTNKRLSGDRLISPCYMKLEWVYDVRNGAICVYTTEVAPDGTVTLAPQGCVGGQSFERQCFYPRATSPWEPYVSEWYISHQALADCVEIVNP